MGQSTEELTSQIEDTRQRMASDLDTPAGPGEPLGHRGASQASGARRALVDEGQGHGHRPERSGLRLGRRVAAPAAASHRRRRSASRALRWPPGSLPSGRASCWPRCCRRAGSRPRPRTGWSRPPRSRASRCSTRPGRPARRSLKTSSSRPRSPPAGPGSPPRSPRRRSPRRRSPRPDGARPGSALTCPGSRAAADPRQDARSDPCGSGRARMPTRLPATRGSEPQRHRTWCHGRLRPHRQPVDLHLEGEIGLLRDLQDLHLLATLVKSTWLVIAQGAQGLRDHELLEIAQSSQTGDRPSARPGSNTRMKAAAPQALIVAP